MGGQINSNQELRIQELSKKKAHAVAPSRWIRKSVPYARYFAYDQVIYIVRKGVSYGSTCLPQLTLRVLSASCTIYYTT